MRGIVFGFSTAISAFLLSGCATVVNGTHQDLALSTMPEGSAATVTGGDHCTTPCKLKLKRRNSVRVDFAQNGYKPTYVLVRSKGGGATVGNIVAGGFIGIIVDSGNGSNNFLTPNPIKVKLAAEGSADEAMLLDKNDKQELVSAHNDGVRADVAPTIGAEAAGLAPPPAATAVAPVAAPAAVPAAAVAPAPAAAAAPTTAN